MSSPHVVTDAGGGHVSVGDSDVSGGRWWAGMGTALGALLEAVGQHMVELHAQAAADVVEMRMALLAVADAVRSLAAGRGRGTGELMYRGTVSGTAEGD